MIYSPYAVSFVLFYVNFFQFMLSYLILLCFILFCLILVYVSLLYLYMLRYYASYSLVSPATKLSTLRKRFPRPSTLHRVCDTPGTAMYTKVTCPMGLMLHGVFSLLPEVFLGLPV